MHSTMPFSGLESPGKRHTAIRRSFSKAQNQAKQARNMDAHQQECLWESHLLFILPALIQERVFNYLSRWKHYKWI